MVVLWSWDGERLTERELTAGLHVVVNSGLVSDLRTDGTAESGPPGEQGGRSVGGSDHERARVARFRPRFRAAGRPVPRPASPVAEAWGTWLPLLNGDGIPGDDPRALIVRRDLGDGRIWGTNSISLVAMSPDGLRYDFTAAPGEPAAWYPVSVAPLSAC